MPYRVPAVTATFGAMTGFRADHPTELAAIVVVASADPTFCSDGSTR
jgi:hypothetical protein